MRTLLARASPLRSGDQLAGVAAADAQERVAAQMALADNANAKIPTALAPNLTPEMVAAVSKLCRLQDLVLIARKTQVTRFRGTLVMKNVSIQNIEHK